MIIFGYGYGGGKINHKENNLCPSCRVNAHFDFFIKYKYEHFYHLKWVTEREVVKWCGNCKQEFEVEYLDIINKLPKNPIPFTVRYGWVVLVAILLVIIISGHILNFIRK